MNTRIDRWLYAHGFVSENPLHWRPGAQLVLIGFMCAGFVLGFLGVAWLRG